MQIKTLTDNAFRMLIYLVIRRSVANSKEISKNLAIPQKNVLIIGRKLKKAKYISIINGPYGGYVMAKKPQDIYVYKVIRIFEQLRLVQSNGIKKDEQTMVDKVLNLFYSELQGLIKDKLTSQTLADLINRFEQSDEK